MLSEQRRRSLLVCGQSYCPGASHTLQPAPREYAHTLTGLNTTSVFGDITRET